MPASAATQSAPIFEPSTDAVLVVDAEGSIVSADRGVEPMFGYKPAELAGQNVSLLLRDPSAFAPLRRGTSGTTDGSPASGTREVKGLRKNGAPITIDLAVTQWMRGGEAFFTGVMRDPRGRREDVLDPATQRLLDTLYRQSGAGMAETDRDDRFVSVNPRYCEIVGRSRAELLGLRLQDIVHPDDLHENFSGMERLSAAGGVPSIEERYVRGDGSVVWVTATATLTPSDTGEPRCLRVVIDVTEPRRSRAALRSVEDRLHRLQGDFAHLSRVSELGEMAAAIAHEINQPLAAVSNYLAGGLMQVKCETPAEALAVAREAMLSAAEQSARAAKIVRGLGDFVRRGSGARETVAPQAIVDSAIALALIDLRHEGIELNHRRYEGDRAVDVDPVQIQQVLVNLLRNAVEALRSNPTGTERRLTIATRENVGLGVVEFSVTDTGPGIADDIRARLFDPFVTAKADGMGMGLAVCRRIIEAHHGTIEAVCGEGVGAEFVVRLPFGDPGSALAGQDQFHGGPR